MECACASFAAGCLAGVLSWYGSKPSKRKVIQSTSCGMDAPQTIYKYYDYAVFPKKYASWYNCNNGQTYNTLEVFIVGAGHADSVGEERVHREGLRYSIDDCNDVRHYFVDNGAKMQGFYCTFPDSGCRVMRELIQFLKTDGNNKMIYFSGHAPGFGGAVLLSKEPLQILTWFDIRRALLQSKFTGTLTLVLDTCRAGVWAQLAHYDAFDLTSDMNVHLPNLMVNMYLSCGPDQLSEETNYNGSFTQAWLAHVNGERPEEATTFEDTGFGTATLRRMVLKSPAALLNQQQPIACSFLFGTNRQYYSSEWCHVSGMDLSFPLSSERHDNVESKLRSLHACQGMYDFGNLHCDLQVQPDRLIKDFVAVQRVHANINTQRGEEIIDKLHHPFVAEKENAKPLETTPQADMESRYEWQQNGPPECWNWRT